jgi:hypothetical protein
MNYNHQVLKHQKGYGRGAEPFLGDPGDEELKLLLPFL